MTVQLDPPAIPTLHLSAGDQTDTLSGSVTDAAGMNISLKISVVDPHVTISLDAVHFGPSVQWSQSSSISTFSQLVFFRVDADPGKTVPCGLLLVGNDVNGDSVQSPSHFIYF